MNPKSLYRSRAWRLVCPMLLFCKRLSLVVNNLGQRTMKTELKVKIWPIFTILIFFNENEKAKNIFMLFSYFFGLTYYLTVKLRCLHEKNIGHTKVSILNKAIHNQLGIFKLLKIYNDNVKNFVLFSHHNFR